MLEIDGEKCYESKKVAGYFNSFYTNVAAELVKKLPRPFNIFSPSLPRFSDFYSSRGIYENSFTLSPVTRLFVHKQLGSLKTDKSTGLDGIFPRFLKDGAELLSGPVTHIVNFSISAEAVPAGFKDARVKPLFKKGSKLEPGNYRPVSVLNTLSKILERAVHDQLVRYLEGKNVLYKYQSGFRSKFSTDTCLLNLTDYIKGEMSKGNMVGMVLIDLQKAFDVVNHDILLLKLKKMGVASVDWFRSYLTCRRQCVNVNGTDSDFSEIQCGVPQGSILGPTLFLCYINDLCSSLECRLSLYADDSALIAAGKCANQLASFLSDQLETCSKWLVDNRLSLHLGKTESIIFGTKKRLSKVGEFNVKCGETVVKRANSVKYLGVQLDENLSGKNHALSVVKKVAARISFLYRNASLLDFNSRKILCSALVQPYFECCCSSWYPSLTAEIKSKFDVLQRRMIRFIFDLKPRDHVDQFHLGKLAWLPFRDRVKFFRLCHVNKILNNLSPFYLSDEFRLISSVHDHNTRASLHNFFIPVSHSQGAMSSSFLYLAKRDWNELPNDIKSITRGECFKTRLKAYFLSL